MADKLNYKLSAKIMIILEVRKRQMKVFGTKKVL